MVERRIKLKTITKMIVWMFLASILTLVFNEPAAVADSEYMESECTEFIIFHTVPEKEIWRMKPDGSEKTLLRKFGWNAQYSPDGTKIAFSEPYSNGIWVMNSDGTNLTKLTYFGSAPTWSPDGTKIAFHHDWSPNPRWPDPFSRRIHVMNADGTHIYFLSDNPGNFPDWSPDGTKIAYGLFGIWLINPDGTGEVQIHPNGDFPAWSPDGEHIAFWSTELDKGLCIMDPDGSNIRNITRYVGTTFPTWSPNGTKIAYADSNGIWMVNIDGTDDHMVSSVGQAPFWWAEIKAAIDVEPNTLMLKNKGRWITVYIELPKGYDASDIDVNTILLNDTTSVDPDAPVTVGDYDKDGLQDLMVKFNRQDIIATSTTGEATLTITGKINETHFEGIDTIKLII